MPASKFSDGVSRTRIISPVSVDLTHKWYPDVELLLQHSIMMMMIMMMMMIIMLMMMMMMMMIMMIILIKKNDSIQRRNWRFLTSSPLHRELSPIRTLKCPGRSRVPITYNTSSAYHVQHVVLCAAWY